MHRIVKYFDKVEDKIRGHLSRRPILYAFIGGAGVIIFWRGIWHTADMIPYLQMGPVSILVGMLILLLTGVFVSGLIGNKIIITSLKGEKKLTEKTEDEIQDEIAAEERRLKHMESALDKIEEEVAEIKHSLEK